MAYGFHVSDTALIRGRCFVVVIRFFSWLLLQCCRLAVCPLNVAQGQDGLLPTVKIPLISVSPRIVTIGTKDRSSSDLPGPS